MLDARTRAVNEAFTAERKEGRKTPSDSVSIEGFETLMKWDWQKHSGDVYAAAAEVAAALGAE